MKMKKFLLFTILLLTFLCFYSCEIREEVDTGDRITIGIVNPHVGSLVGFKSLIDNGIIDIPNAQYLAICYEQVERNIAAVENYIRDQNDDLFRLDILSGELSGDNLFSENELSEQFLRVFQNTKGIFFLGGADIPPGIYDQKTNLLS